jgi:isopenicillin N synthase-like dioxygenase
MNNISIIDLSLYTGGNIALREELARSFVQIIANEGIIGFKGHPVCNEPLNIGERVRELFLLPLQQYEAQGMGALRGYSQGFRDQMMWHTGPELGAESPLVGRLPDNKWPEELAGFKSTTLELYALLEDLSRQMMSMLALGLGADETRWLEAMENHSSVLRYIFFPAHGDYAPGDLRLEDHIDGGMFAILPPATGGGFEMFKGDNWFEVKSQEGVIFAYPGLMTEYLSNGKIKAVRHRVIASGYGEHTRLSFPFFMIPHPDFRLTPPQGLVNTGEASLYPEYTVDELLLHYIEKYLAGTFDSGWARDILAD